jgi:hypothetical protein
MYQVFYLYILTDFILIINLLVDTVYLIFQMRRVRKKSKGGLFKEHFL